jgi:hypothetical protein
MDEQAKKTIIELFLQTYKISFKPDLDDLRNEFREGLEEFKDGAYGKMDKIVGELQKFRAEQVVMNQRLDDIESTPTLAHELKKVRSAQ